MGYLVDDSERKIRQKSKGIHTVISRADIVNYAKQYIYQINLVWDATHAEPFTKEQLEIARSGMKKFKEMLAADCIELRRMETSGILTKEGRHWYSELMKIKANMQVAWNANPRSDKNDWDGELYSAKSDFIMISGQYKNK